MKDITATCAWIFLDQFLVHYYEYMQDNFAFFYNLNVNSVTTSDLMSRANYIYNMSLGQLFMSVFNRQLLILISLLLFGHFKEISTEGVLH